MGEKASEEKSSQYNTLGKNTTPPKEYLENIINKQLGYKFY